MKSKSYPLLLMVLLVAVILPACKYSKGSRYISLLPGDTIQYVILDKGKGVKLSKKVAFLKLQHEYKGNSCRVSYVTDSVKLGNQKAILLFNSVMPEIEKDILTKGFFGSFTSKQVVVYKLVSYSDFNTYFQETELGEKQQ